MHPHLQLLKARILSRIYKSQLRIHVWTGHATSAPRCNPVRGGNTFCCLTIVSPLVRSSASVHYESTNDIPMTDKNSTAPAVNFTSTSDLLAKRPVQMYSKHEFTHSVLVWARRNPAFSRLYRFPLRRRACLRRVFRISRPAGTLSASLRYIRDVGILSNIDTPTVHRHRPRNKPAPAPAPAGDTVSDSPFTVSTIVLGPPFTCIDVSGRTELCGKSITYAEVAIDCVSQSCWDRH